MAAEAPRRKWRRCRGALGLALLFDAVGLAGLLVGGLLETDVSDLLIYLGGVAAFFSLPWWVFWHLGNLEVPLEELRDDVGLGWLSADAWSLESWRARRLALLARAFSAHFSLPSASASASASAQSQVGRLRAHFAASTTSASGGSINSSRAEKKAALQQQEQQQRRPSQTQAQTSGSDAELRRARLALALPAFSFFSAGTAASQDLPGSSQSQDRGKQESSKSFIDFPDLPGSSHSKDRGKEESSRSFFSFLCHKQTQTDE